jgi:hypothetical protein
MSTYDRNFGDETTGDTTLRKEEIHILPSTIETIDFSVFDYVNDNLNLHLNTNDGWEKVPVIWVTAERAYQIKREKELRDMEGALIYPFISVERTSMNKDLSRKGAFQANILPYNSIQGGSISAGKRVYQKKTSEFANADLKSDAARRLNNSKGPRFVRRETNKVVYQTVLIPQPVYVQTSYTISLRTEYQQQMNDLLQPFMTVPGNINYISLTKDGHYYEAQIDPDFSLDNTVGNLSEEERKYETKVTINVVGYLLGSGVNDDRPKIAVYENAADWKMPRERAIASDKPDYINEDTKNQGIDGGYRE